MKGLLILLTVFVLIPVCMGLVSSYRAGVLPYQMRRAERRRKLLDQIARSDVKPEKTHYQAWEDDYMGRPQHEQARQNVSQNSQGHHTGHHHLCGTDHDNVGMVKRYTRPFNRFKPRVRDAWDDVYLWYLNTPIPIYWNFHIYRWWIRGGVAVLLVLLLTTLIQNILQLGT